jgi:hypothetical protein
VPFVRFARDRRGYEHVYLVDVSKERGRSRVLYWFRTPPGVKVGRSPFDPETQRSLERQNPGVAFDWSQIIAARMPPAAPVENWREKRRIERAIKRARATEAGEADRVDVAEQTPPSEETELDLASGELVPDELDLDVEPGEEVAARPAGEGATEPPSPQAPIAGAEQPGRRRRRRRGRRTSSPPAEANAGTSAQNGPLDPPSAPEKPSDEE